MAITQRTRKILWGRAANRCAICRRQLIAEPTLTDRDAVLGEECHIESGAEGGPRVSGISDALLDEYDNLVLLCSNGPSSPALLKVERSETVCHRGEHADA